MVVVEQATAERSALVASEQALPVGTGVQSLLLQGVDEELNGRNTSRFELGKQLSVVVVDFKGARGSEVVGKRADHHEHDNRHKLVLTQRLKYLRLGHAQEGEHREKSHSEADEL